MYHINRKIINIKIINNNNNRLCSVIDERYERTATSSLSIMSIVVVDETSGRHSTLQDHALITQKTIPIIIIMVINTENIITTTQHLAIIQTLDSSRF